MSIPRFPALLCATLLASACTTVGDRAVSAPTAEAPPAVEQPLADANDDPLVCENVTRTGTRISERVCMRRSVRDAKRRDGQEMLEEVQRRGTMETTRQE